MSKRREPYEQLQMVCAGHSVEACIAALTDFLAATIAFSAEDLEHADRMVDLTASDLKSAIRENWGYVREVRAQSELAGTTSTSN